MLFVLHPCCKETWTEDAGRARRRRVQLRGGAARLIGTIGVPPQVHQTARLQTKPHVVGSCDSIFKAHEDRLDETKFCESIEGDKELVSESGSEAVREGGREGERERGAIRFAGRSQAASPRPSSPDCEAPHRRSLLKWCGAVAVCHSPHVSPRSLTIDNAARIRSRIGPHWRAMCASEREAVSGCTHALAVQCRLRVYESVSVNGC
eukprot:GHVU01012773.1.p1 GENE.GHVU01012773.1~~GHVU01012773.1.p1  ORF type:complete len:207 (+),score=15.07 GHVU01012773.1:752-1372(+)